jgi:hypothetical protein
MWPNKETNNVTPVTKSTSLTDMPSSLLNKGGKSLVLNASETAYDTVDLINGFFNFQPTNYLKTRGAFADVLAGVANMNIGIMMSGTNDAFDNNFVSNYKQGRWFALAKKLRAMGIFANCQNWFGTSSYTAANAQNTSQDIRRSDLAPTWSTNTTRSPAAFAMYNATNTATTDPLIFRPMDDTGATYAPGQPVVQDTCEVYHQDLAAGGNDAFVVMAGVYDAPKTITGITRANPGVFNIAAHGYSVGDLVLLECAGMTQFDGRILVFVNNVVDANNVQMRLTGVSFGGASVDTTAYGVFTSGTAKKVTLTAATQVSRTINGGVDLVRKAVYTFTGAVVWTVWKSAGNTNKLDIKGINCYQSGNAQILLHRYLTTNILSWAGTQTAINEIGQLTSTNVNSGFAGGTASTSGKTQLMIIEIGLADASSGNSQSIMESNLTTIIQRLKASGHEVLLVLGEEYNITGAGSATQPQQDAIKNAAYKIAVQEGIALCDIRTLRGSYAAALAAGFSAGDIRPTRRGNADSANVISNFFPMLTQNNAVKALGSTAGYVPIKVSILAGGTSKTILKEMVGNHTPPNSAGLYADTGFSLGAVRPHTTPVFWSGVETGEDGLGNPIYNWTTLDADILGADSRNATVLYTFSSTPQHAVRQDWYNAVTQIARSTVYNTLGTLRRPATGNNCLYVLTQTGTTAASAPASYPTSNAGSDFPYNMLQVRPGDSGNASFLVSGAGMSVAQGIFQPPGVDGGGRNCTTTVVDGTTVWQLAGDPWNHPTNAFPSEPAKAARFATAIAQRYNAVSAVNPTGKKMIKHFELGSNEPNVQDSDATGLTAYAASKQFSIATGTQLVDTCIAQGNAVRAVDATCELGSPGFTQYGSIASGSVNKFMQAFNTAGTLRGYDTCDIFNFHPYNSLYSPVWATDIIDATFFGFTAAKTYIAALPAGNNPRGIPYRNMKIQVSEWGAETSNNSPTLNAWLALPNPQARYADKMIVKLMSVAQDCIGFYEFKYDMVSCGNMQLVALSGNGISGTVQPDPQGVRKANNDMFAFVGGTMTEAWRYIDGTNRFEFKINGVTYIYARP